MPSVLIAPYEAEPGEMCDCEVLKASTPDGTLKTSQWLTSNFSANGCIHKQSSSEESVQSTSPVNSEPEVKSAGENDRCLGVKSTGENGTKNNTQPPHRHRRRHTKSHKRKRAGPAVESTDRFKRTATVLRCSGLLQITRSIAQLLHDNEKMQTEIDKLRHETREHSIELQRQLQKNLEAQRETTGTCSQEGQKLLTKLTQFEWNWILSWTHVIFIWTADFVWQNVKEIWQAGREKTFPNLLKFARAHTCYIIAWLLFGIQVTWGAFKKLFMHFDEDMFESKRKNSQLGYSHVVCNGTTNKRSSSSVYYLCLGAILGDVTGAGSVG